MAKYFINMLQTVTSRDKHIDNKCLLNKCNKYDLQIVKGCVVKDFTE